MTKKLAGILLTLLLCICAFTVSAYADLTAEFVADSNTTGKLYVNGMESGKTYTYNFTPTDKEAGTDTGIDASPASLTGLSAGTITVKEGTEEKAKIEITKKAAPDTGSFTVTGADEDAANGKISGVTTDMEYKLSTAETYTTCTGTEITGCKKGEEYDIRYKADGTALASESVQIEIPASEKYGIYVGGVQVSSANCKSNSAWSYDVATQTLTLKDDITNAAGEGIKITFQSGVDDKSVDTIVVAKDNLTVSSTGPAESQDSSYGIYSLNAGGLTIKGGTLNVTSASTSASKTINHSCGISANSLKVEAGAGIVASSGSVETGAEKYDSSAISIETDIENFGTIKATSAAGYISDAITCKTLTNNAAGVITATANGGTGTIYSTAIKSASTTVKNQGTINATANGGQNNTAIDGPVENTYTGTVMATAGDTSTGSSTGISGNVTNGNSGTIYASAGSALSGNSTGISGDVSSSGTLTAAASNATAASSGITGAVKFSGGKLEAQAADINDADKAISGNISYGISTTTQYIGKTAADAKAVTTQSTAYNDSYVKIVANGYVTVEKVTLTAEPDTIYLTENTEPVLTATVTMSDGSAYAGEYKWSIDSLDILTVDTTAKTATNKATLAGNSKTGKTVITVSVDDAKSAQATITVKDNPAATSLTLDKSTIGVKTGSTGTLTATLTPTTAVDSVKWSTSDTNVLTLTPSTDTLTCTIKGTKAGEAMVYAKLASGNGDTAACKVVVSSTGNAYKITPSYGAWYIDKSDPYTFSINIPSDGPSVSEVYINSKLMSNITATRYSSYTAVSVPYKSMKTLNRGYSQQLKVVLSDGTILYGKVAVIYTTDAPPTGDVSLLPFAVSAIVSAAGATSITLGLTKKKKK